MVRSTRGARSWRRRVSVSASVKKATESVAVTVSTSAWVYCRGVCACSAACSAARADVQHVAAGGFDEQRFLGAEVIGDLAWKRVRGRRDVRDRGAGQAALLEKPAGHVEQARPHLAPGRAGRADGVLGIAARPFGSCLDGLGSHFSLSSLICMLYKQINQGLGMFGPSQALPARLKILITRASVDPGRELNGRSQQSLLFGDFDVAGPVGPSSRASAF